MAEKGQVAAFSWDEVLCRLEDDTGTTRHRSGSHRGEK